MGLVVLAPSFTAVSNWLDRQSEPVLQAAWLIPRISEGLPWRAFHQSVVSLARGGGTAETVAALLAVAAMLVPIWRWFVVGTNAAMFLGMAAVLGSAAGYPDRPPVPAFIGAGVLVFFAIVALILAVSTYGKQDLPVTAALLAIPVGVFFWWLLCCGVALVLAIALHLAGKSPDDNTMLYAVGYGLAAVAVIVAGVRSLFS